MVNLGFEKCMDNKAYLNFVPLIYQERSNYQSHHVIVFDVNRFEVSRHFSLLSNINIRNHLRRNAQGFGTYAITRTSEVYKQK